MTNRGIIARLLSGAWRVLDGFRKGLHLILMLALAIAILAGLAGDGPAIPKSAALVLAPQGALVDQLSSDPLALAIAKAQDAPVQETLLKDMVDALAAAKDDERIKAVLLELEELSGGLTALTKLQEFGKALIDFKTSGKPVIALGDAFSRDQYYLAALADEIYLNPNGLVLIEGYARYRTFYKEALDKLSIDYNVFRVGEYKSAEEPYLRDDMSDESKEASLAVLNVIWESYQEDVTAARGLATDALQGYADRAPELLAASGGSFARLALDYGLVDRLATRGEMRDRLIEIVGADPEDEYRFPAVTHDSYLVEVRAAESPATFASSVAVIVASGSILDGSQPPGTIGGDSTARLIREVREDDDLKALVLRVDSGGGSQFASDVIFEELKLYQATERPLVVSMGGVAASGGYWISMSADEIWANRNTITGSIGVTAAIPTAQRTLARLGVHADGVGTTKLAGQLRVDRELGPELAALLTQGVEQTYQQFIAGVADHREKTVEEIDQIARGRIWVGQDAYELGLVDKLGNLDDAIQSAAELAGLEEGDYGIEYVDRELELVERLALQFSSVWTPVTGLFLPRMTLPEPVGDALEQLMGPIEALASFNDPRGLYAYCFCDAF